MFLKERRLMFANPSRWGWIRNGCFHQIGNCFARKSFRVWFHARKDPRTKVGKKISDQTLDVQVVWPDISQLLLMQNLAQSPDAD